MPVLNSLSQHLPAWCELRSFEIIELSPGARYTFDRRDKEEKLIVGSGSCIISYGGSQTKAIEGANLDLSDPDSQFVVTDTILPTTLIHMTGRWGTETGGSGLFTVSQSDNPKDLGDLVSYPKQTDFDSHYHDCDEYWILYSGSGIAVSEGIHYEVKAGDCIATGMGHHHDFPIVHENVKAVYFETTLEGAKRRGHLWNHSHGTAQPQPDRL